MITKEKPCKGIGQAKGLGCGKLTFHRIYGLGKMCGCYSEWLLNSEQGKIKLAKATLKATKPSRDLEKADKERKTFTSLQNLKVSATNICHKYIRERDKHKPCISCGANWNEHFQAGHFFKAELYSILKYHIDNIHGQCRICNLHKDGNENEYRLNLPARIGKTRFKNVERLATESKETEFKWDRQDLKDYYNLYKDLYKEVLK